MRISCKSFICIALVLASCIPLCASVAVNGTATIPTATINPNATTDPTAVYDVMYTITDLHTTFVIPGNWVTVTRATPKDSADLTELDFYDYDAFMEQMKAQDIYLIARQSDSIDTFEIMVSSFPCNSDITSITDFRNCLPFELEQLAKSSFSALNNESDGPEKVVYETYEVVPGKVGTESDAPYMVFSGSYVDDMGNTVYHSLFDTYIAGSEIQLDITSFAPIDQEHFDLAKKIMSTMKVPPCETSNRKLMETLRYVALGVLALALVVVIILFVISQVKIKKAERVALEAAASAAASQNNGLNFQPIAPPAPTPALGERLDNKKH